METFKLLIDYLDKHNIPHTEEIPYFGEIPDFSKVWGVDIEDIDSLVYTIEYRNKLGWPDTGGFGISLRNKNHCYGEGCDEWYNSFQELEFRLNILLLNEDIPKNIGNGTYLGFTNGMVGTISALCTNNAEKIGKYKLGLLGKYLTVIDNKYNILHDNNKMVFNIYQYYPRYLRLRRELNAEIFLIRSLNYVNAVAEVSRFLKEYNNKLQDICWIGSYFGLKG